MADTALAALRAATGTGECAATARRFSPEQTAEQLSPSPMFFELSPPAPLLPPLLEWL
jgi:hypothetical protein